MASRILEECTGCGICEPLCPTHSITAGIKIHVIDTDTCENCGICIPSCPVEAIKPEPKKKQ